MSVYYNTILMLNLESQRTVQKVKIPKQYNCTTRQVIASCKIKTNDTIDIKLRWLII